MYNFDAFRHHNWLQSVIFKTDLMANKLWQNISKKLVSATVVILYMWRPYWGLENLCTMHVRVLIVVVIPVSCLHRQCIPHLITFRLKNLICVFDVSWNQTNVFDNCVWHQCQCFPPRAALLLTRIDRPPVCFHIFSPPLPSLCLFLQNFSHPPSFEPHPLLPWQPLLCPVTEHGGGIISHVLSRCVGFCFREG